MYLPVSDDEIPALVALINRAYRGAATPSGWSTETAYIAGDRTTADLLRADLEQRPAAVLLKWADHPAAALQGCVWLEPLGGGAWYLGSLAIEPVRQNAGVGRTMLSAAERWIAEQGGDRVRMTVVNVRQTLIDWYRRRGYDETGETEPFPYADKRFGTPLRDDLCFVVLQKRLTEA